MTTDEAFQHSPALPGPRLIRVIKLSPSWNKSAPVRISLKTVCVDKFSSYECLSYTWDGQVPDRPIYCGRKLVLVTANAEPLCVVSGESTAQDGSGLMPSVSTRPAWRRIQERQNSARVARSWHGRQREGNSVLSSCSMHPAEAYEGSEATHPSREEQVGRAGEEILSSAECQMDA